MDAKFNLVLDPDTVTHTSNVIMDQKLLSCRSIREFSVSPPPTKSRISAIELAPQTLLMPVVQEIFSDMVSGNAWTNRIPLWISRAGIDGPIPIPLQFTAELAKLPPKVPVTVLEPGFPLELAASLMPHPMKKSGTLGLGIKVNPLPQTSEIPIDWTLPLMVSSPIIGLHHTF